MKRGDFRQKLADSHYTEEQMATCEKGVELLESYLAELPEPIPLEAASADDVPSFAESLIARTLNERAHFVGIYSYAGMIQNVSLQVGILELVDGFEILENLYRVVAEELGTEAQAEIFAGVTLPALGTTPLTWTRVNAIVFPRLEAIASPETVKRILRAGLRNLSDAQYFPIKERYQAFADIDAFLEDRGKRHLENLITHRDEGTPYFNQFIDDAVIDFVRETPEIGRGVRHRAPPSLRPRSHTNRLNMWQPPPPLQSSITPVTVRS